MSVVDIVERLKKAQYILEPLVGDQKNKVVSLKINLLLSEMVALRGILEHSGGIPEIDYDQQKAKDQR